MVTRKHWLVPILVLLLLTADQVESKKKKKKKVRASVSGEGGVEEEADDTTGNSMMIIVNDVEDRVQSGTAQANVAQALAPPTASRDSHCSVIAYRQRPRIPDLPDGANGCTLRHALELLPTVDSAKVVITMRSGRFRLAAPLPEITLAGKVEIIGGPAAKKVRKAKVPPKKAGKPTETELRLERRRLAELDDVDAHYKGPGSVGQSSAIGTIIDGEQKFQIFRTGAFTELMLMGLRLEDGRAVTKMMADPRASLGGAVCAFGKLVLSNVVMRNNRAINGGAIYTEAPLDARNSHFEPRWEIHRVRSSDTLDTLCIRPSSRYTGYTSHM